MSEILDFAIISIGDELLAGRTVNTNAAWLGRRISEEGHRVVIAWTIADDAEEIKARIEEATALADHVIVTGGLGPTDDDLTREVVAGMLGCGLVENPEQRALIVDLFERIGRGLNERTLDQAMVPEKSEVVLNPEGTAPGMIVRINDRPVYLLPGVPYELKGLFETILSQRIGSSDGILEKNWLTGGIPESELAILLEPVDAFCVRNVGLKLAYLPSSGVIRLRLLAIGQDDSLALLHEEAAAMIESYVGAWIIGREVDRIEALVAQRMIRRNASVATAESCTGGMIGERLTSVPGASDWYLGGVVSYANSLKRSLLDVPEETLHEHGAVSQETAEAMARGAIVRCGSDFGVSTTGVAGPGGGTPEKPVGTVWIGVAWRDGDAIRAEAKLHRFRGERDSIRLRSVNAALLMLVERAGSLSS